MFSNTLLLSATFVIVGVAFIKEMITEAFKAKPRELFIHNPRSQSTEIPTGYKKYGHNDWREYIALTNRINMILSGYDDEEVIAILKSENIIKERNDIQ